MSVKAERKNAAKKATQKKERQKRNAQKKHWDNSGSAQKKKFSVIKITIPPTPPTFHEICLSTLYRILRLPAGDAIQICDPDKEIVAQVQSGILNLARQAGDSDIIEFWGEDFNPVASVFFVNASIRGDRDL